MSIILIFVGAFFAGLGLAMAGNRAGYWFFVVGPRSIALLAAIIAGLALWAANERLRHAVIPHQTAAARALDL